MAHLVSLFGKEKGGEKKKSEVEVVGSEVRNTISVVKEF